MGHTRSFPPFDSEPGEPGALATGELRPGSHPVTHHLPTRFPTSPNPQLPAEIVERIRLFVERIWMTISPSALFQPPITAFRGQ
jgi:hypothetical protein